MARVLVVGKGPPDRGGISAFLTFVMASELSDAWSMHLINLTREDVPGPRKLTARNIRRLAEDVASVWRETRPGDIVHVHSALAGHMVVLRAGALAAAGRMKGARAVIHAHSGRAEAWFTTPWRRLIGRLVLTSANRLVAVAGGVRDVLATTVGDTRVLLIPNGVDPDVYRPSGVANAPPRILFAGVLTPRKGVTDLLEAASLLEQRGVAHELWIAGGIPEEGEQAQADARRGAGATVRWLGPRPHEEMPRLYGLVDIFCLPSWGEALPMSVLEAMASGLAVVGSSVGDVPRVIEHGVSGMIVSPRGPHGLADALQRLIEDERLRRRLGSAAAARVRSEFTATRTAGALAQLYRDLEREMS